MLRRAAAQWRGGLRSLAPLTGGWAALPPSTRPHSTSSDSESSDEELGADQRAFLDELHAAAAALEDGSAGVQPDLVELLGVPPPDARDTDVPPEQQRLLQAGVVGAPNAGKSTLVNQLCGAKVGRCTAGPGRSTHMYAWGCVCMPSASAAPTASFS